MLRFLLSVFMTQRLKGALPGFDVQAIDHVKHHITRSDISERFEAALRIDRLREVGELSQHVEGVYGECKTSFQFTI